MFFKYFPVGILCFIFCVAEGLNEGLLVNAAIRPSFLRNASKSEMIARQHLFINDVIEISIYNLEIAELELTDPPLMVSISSICRSVPSKNVFF